MQLNQKKSFKQMPENPSEVDNIYMMIDNIEMYKKV